MRRYFSGNGIIGRCGAFFMALLLVVYLAVCGIIRIVPNDRVPSPGGQDDQKTNAPDPTPLKPKYETSFDPGEEFNSDIEKEASERIDGIIKRAVTLMNSLGDRLAEDLDPGAYGSLPKAKDSLKSADEVLFYEKVEENAEKFGDYSLDQNDYDSDLFYPVTNAIDALRLDRPELFLYSDMMPSSDFYGTSYELTYYMPNEWLNHPESDRDKVRRAVDLYYAVVDRIIEKMPQGLDNYEKCFYFIFVVSESVTYDVAQTSLFDMYQAYNVLVKGRAVCAGYAEAMYELMRRADIKCEIVKGESPGEGRHAWNAVYSGGEKYYIDVTWYDTDSESENYRAGNTAYLFMTEKMLEEYGYVKDPDPAN